MISLSIADGVAEIVLNAPYKLNSLDEQALRDLSKAYDDAAAAASRGEVRALLLRGEGRAFCAGRDIAGVTPETDDVQGYLGGLLQPLLKKMTAFPAPTFAAAQGACLGVGLGLLLATDVVYVAENAKFGSPFANLGATLDSGGHWYFTERLGMHLSTEGTLGTYVAMCRETTFPENKPQAIQFRHAEPAGSLAALEAYFRCPVTFGADIDAIILPEERLDQPNAVGDESIWKFLTSHIEETLVEEPTESALDRRVVLQIANMLSEGIPTLADIACGDLIGGSVPEECAGAFNDTESQLSLATSVFEVATEFSDAAQ